MNFTRIFNGMVGRDFIAAFNDNFNITNDTFLSILATLIYKVKSTDIKEFKVIDNVVSYTLDPEPQEGEEDTRIWTPVDITQWGNILGNIEDQTDLWNILQDKAAVETVETINNLLSTLRNEFDTLKDNVEEAEYQIKVAMQYLLEESYGDKVVDARIYVEKIYSSEEEKVEPLKSLNVGINDVAFEVKYELKLAEGVDVNEFLAGSGEYDEESEWIKEKYNVGILRENEKGEPKYKITDFGTGW